MIPGKWDGAWKKKYRSYQHSSACEMKSVWRFQETPKGGLYRLVWANNAAMLSYIGHQRDELMKGVSGCKWPNLKR